MLIQCFPQDKKKEGGIWAALCIVHFIEGILSFDVYTWKEGVLQERRGVLHPLPFGGNTVIQV